MKGLPIRLKEVSDYCRMYGTMNYVNDVERLKEVLMDVTKTLDILIEALKGETEDE